MLKGIWSDLVYAARSLAKAQAFTFACIVSLVPLDFRGRLSTVSLQTEANVAPTLIRVQVTRIGDGYLNTMGIPLLNGSCSMS